MGQIASFIENLHLSYTEVVEQIPYRNLIIMQKDKLRAISGTIRKEVTEEEYFKGRESKLK